MLNQTMKIDINKSVIIIIREWAERNPYDSFILFFLLGY